MEESSYSTHHGSLGRTPIPLEESNSQAQVSIESDASAMIPTGETSTSSGSKGEPSTSSGSKEKLLPEVEPPMKAKLKRVVRSVPTATTGTPEPEESSYSTHNGSMPGEVDSESYPTDTDSGPTVTSEQSAQSKSSDYSSYESSNSMDEIDLDELVEKIKRTHQGVIDGSLRREQAHHAIGYLIDNYKKYEQEGGIYKDRVIAVFPDCADIINLKLNYLVGKTRQRLHLVLMPEKGTSEIVHYKLTEIGDEPVEESVAPNESSSSSVVFHCPYKNDRCCYLQQPHNEMTCRDCCLAKPHLKGQ